MANASNAALVQFGQNTGAGQTVTHFGIGFAAAGAGDITAQIDSSGNLTFILSLNGSFDSTLDLVGNMQYPEDLAGAIDGEMELEGNLINANLLNGSLDLVWDLGDMNLKSKQLPGHPCYKKIWLHK